MGVLLTRLRGLDGVAVDRVAALALGLARVVPVCVVADVRHRVLTALVLAVLPVALALRRRWPLGVIPVAGATAFYTVHPALPGVVGIAGLLAALPLAYGAGAFLEARRSWIALLVLLAIWTGAALESDAVVASLVFFDLALAVLPWIAGRLARERSARERDYREQAERLDAERERHALDAAWSERTRIAREIHDVIAHSVSVMVIQAAGARTVMDAEPERAEAALRSVERAGREALVEMWRLIDVLGDGSKTSALTPQPGLDDLAALVTNTTAAGLTTTLGVEGEPAPVSPGLGLCAYRIVQEALTNTIKHAGPAYAEVRLHWRNDALELEVRDDGRGAANGAGGSGHGLAGMRERAALHGGSVRAEPAPDGGFTVRARLPLAGGSGR